MTQIKQHRHCNTMPVPSNFLTFNGEAVEKNSKIRKSIYYKIKAQFDSLLQTAQNPYESTPLHMKTSDEDI